MTENGAATNGVIGATCCRTIYRPCDSRAAPHKRSLSCRAESRHLSLLTWAMPRDYNFWIYIVTNRNESVLYIGVTNSLSRRTWEHREGTRTGFASDYRCKKLIYYEHYRDIRDALARESQLKKWSRAKKIALISRFIPSCLDLGMDVLQDR